jgi:hypothetical protein
MACSSTLSWTSYSISIYPTFTSCCCQGLGISTCFGFASILWVVYGGCFFLLGEMRVPVFLKPLNVLCPVSFVISNFILIRKCIHHPRFSFRMWLCISSSSSSRSSSSSSNNNNKMRTELNYFLKMKWSHRFLSGNCLSVICDFLISSYGPIIHFHRAQSVQPNIIELKF